MCRDGKLADARDQRNTLCVTMGLPPPKAKVSHTNTRVIIHSHIHLSPSLSFTPLSLSLLSISPQAPVTGAAPKVKKKRYIEEEMGYKGELPYRA